MSQQSSKPTRPAPQRPATQPPGEAASHLAQPPVPWHFKLLASAAGIYVALRIVQMLGWVGVSVKDLHLVFDVLLIALNGGIAAWGLLAWWRRWPLINGFLMLATLGWYLFVPQLAFGVTLYLSGHRAPVGWFHYIYGVAALLGIGAGYLYRRRLAGREGMLYGLVALFLMLVAIRALMTGAGLGR